MGRWLARFFERRGHSVKILDPRRDSSGRARVPTIEIGARSAEVVVFATPIAETAPLLAKLVATGTDALVFDVLSLKSPILPAVRRAAAAGLKITSVHPMFGPTVRRLRGRNLLVLSCGNPSADRAVGRLFRGSGLTISRSAIEGHDRLIAETLGLPQVLDLLFLLVLGSGRTAPPHLARAAGTSFRRHAASARALLRQSAALTLQLQVGNPYTHASLRRIRANVDRLARLLRAEDLDALEVAIDRGSDRLRAVRPRD